MTDAPKNHQSDSVSAPIERPTLKTIARISGLAVATVSRALHDAPDIGANTKKRVRAIAEEIGYRPNRAGVRLRTGKTNVISLVMSTDHDVMNHTARLISSIAAELTGTSYHMNVTPYFPTEDPMNPVRYIVETQSADAILLNQIQPQDPRVAYLMERNFPFATHGRSDWHEKHAYFDFNNHRFGELCVEKFAHRGRRHVLIIAPPNDQTYAQHMIAGTQSKAKELGLKVNILQAATSDDSSIDIEAAFTEFLAENPGLDAVICPSTSATMAATARAETIGRIVGDTIDIFAKEAIPFLSRFRPAMLTVKEDVGTAGSFLARAAMQAIDDPTKPPMQGLETPTFSV